MKAFINAEIFIGEKILSNKVLLIQHDKIMGIGNLSDLPSDIETIDCNGGVLTPGFIDLQIYGDGNYLFSSQPDGKLLHKMADRLIRKGTTAIFITLATNSFEVFEDAMNVVHAFPHAAIKGVHLEGPFINPEKRGAHVLRYIKKPKIQDAQRLIESSEGVLKMMTIAPEQCSTAVIKYLLKNNVLLSAGHSNATFQQAKKGFNLGIQTATHLFNAMSPFKHRNSGLPGAIFLDESVMSSIIADGFHVDFEAVRIAKRLMHDRLFYITDAVAAACLGPYKHIKHKSRYTLPDGTLSGSALTMLQSVKNGVEKAGFSLEESLRMATTYPAKLAGFPNEGRIAKGFKANLNCLSKELTLNFTVFNGNLIK